MEREKVLDKIRKLMAKASDPCNVHEAAAAAEAAQRLMPLHRLEESDVSAFTPEEEDPITDVDLLHDSKQKTPTTWQQILLGAIAKSCCCRLIVSSSRYHHKGQLRVFGRRSELEAVKYLYQAFTNQINDLCVAWADRQEYYMERRDRNGFRYGAACTISERLRAARQVQEQEFLRQAGTTTALVPLRRAEEAVAEHIRQNVGRVVTVAHRGTSSWEGYLAGKWQHTKYRWETLAVLWARANGACHPELSPGDQEDEKQPALTRNVNPLTPNRLGMSSRFPGMDPFIESQAWETFHAALITGLMETLTSRLRPRYIVRVEERVYLDRRSLEQPSIVRPDVTVMERQRTYTASRPQPDAPVAPVLLTLPMPGRVRERFLSVRQSDSLEVVTVIEVLSPSNKRTGDGRREYLAKREAVLQTSVHLVELDLLRGGERLPTLESAPPADYFVFVCRGNRRPQAEVYPCILAEPLPSFALPLSVGDADVTVELQHLLNTIFDRAGFDYSLDYRLPLSPPMATPQLDWVQSLLPSGQ